MSVVNVIRTVLKEMILNRKGNIINISSFVGLHGNIGQSNYAASKAAINGLTKSLAKEVGGCGIRVDAIAPGFIETGMTAAIPEKRQKLLISNIPLKRMGLPEDIAETALFIDNANYLTGQIIEVDG
ncbi:SDR family oxidoreductase [Lactiplantibacillus pentosus]|uniref:SDR family oxidoreductase n=1 Tax=Lactiplantibacillus pentosus TaxID=1589 RepID=UPI0021A2960B|nr:SDR family oxidoreductase [Lactiplantibacillus pentosus]MCT3311096.1 SDR family oxidoreductase [Lactiplantibacillus pentosus]